jgi:hypothetical protein
MAPFTRSRARILKAIAKEAALQGKMKIIKRYWMSIIPVFSTMANQLIPPHYLSLPERYDVCIMMFQFILNNKDYFKMLCEVSPKLSLTLAEKITEIKRGENCPQMMHDLLDKTSIELYDC